MQSQSSNASMNIDRPNTLRGFERRALVSEPGMKAVLRRVQVWLRPNSGPVDARLFDQAWNRRAICHVRRTMHLSDDEHVDVGTDGESVRRAVAQYRALLAVLPKSGPIWLRAIVFYPLFIAGLIQSWLRFPARPRRE